MLLGDNMNCSTCDTALPKERIELNLDTCLDCSTESKYSAHVVYPHKTGAFVQPIRNDNQADDLARLDRRSSKKNKKAYGDRASNSWDIWLKKYQEAKTAKPKPRPTVVWSEQVSHINTSEVTQSAYDKFDMEGYDKAIDFVIGLYTTDKISLVTKSSVINKLTSYYVLPKKVRKLLPRV